MSDLDNELLEIVKAEDLSSEQKCDEVKKLFAINNLKKQGGKCIQKYLLNFDTTHCFKVLERSLYYLEAPFFAVNSNDIPLLKLLIEYGYFSNQALFCAIALGRVDACRYLLTKDPDINFENREKWPQSPVSTATYIRTSDHVKYDNDTCLKTFNAFTRLKEGIKLYSLAKSSPVSESKEATKKPTYAVILAKFALACSEDSKFVILYLAGCMQDICLGKKSVEQCLFLPDFTLECYRIFNNPYFPDKESQNDFNEILLPEWSRYSTQNPFFASSEEATKFLVSIGVPLDSKEKKPSLSLDESDEKESKQSGKVLRLTELVAHSGSPLHRPALNSPPQCAALPEVAVPCT